MVLNVHVSRQHAQCMTSSDHIDQHINHDSDQCDMTTGNPSSWLSSSDLTPLIIQMKMCLSERTQMRILMRLCIMVVGKCSLECRPVLGSGGAECG